MGRVIKRIDLLFDDRPLPLKNHPHKLSGDYAGLWKCHIDPDWLLIYDSTEKEIRLYRTGTHSIYLDKSECHFVKHSSGIFVNFGVVGQLCWVSGLYRRCLQWAEMVGFLYRIALHAAKEFRTSEFGSVKLSSTKTLFSSKSVIL